MPSKVTAGQRLKDIRDKIVGKVMEQCRVWGDPLPRTKLAEEFVDPIIRKVEVDNETSRVHEMYHGQEKVSAAGWTGEQGHSVKVPENTTISREEIGTVQMGTGKFIPHHDCEVSEKREDSPAVAAAREVLRVMRQMPEWKAAIEKVAYSNLNANQKETAYRKIFVAFKRFFGDPRKPLDKKIVVG